MHLDALDTYRCPSCGDVLRADRDDAVIEEAELTCAGCDARYPVVRGVARFVPADNYARTFGWQWNRFAETQLDSKNGLGLSEKRLWAETRWPRDLKGETVLEAGSGAGRFTEVLAPSGARVFTFDYSAAVDANRRSNGGADNVDFAQADITRMPFAPGTFDRVLCIGVLQHTPSPRETLRSLCRAVKPGGHLAVDSYTVDRLQPLRGKYYLRRFTAGRDPEALFRPVEAYFNAWYAALGLAARVIGPVAHRAGAVVGIADYRAALPDADPKVLREIGLLDTFDHLSPRYDQPQTAETIRGWLQDFGMTDIDVARGYNGVEARARRPSA